MTDATLVVFVLIAAVGVGYGMYQRGQHRLAVSRNALTIRGYQTALSASPDAPEAPPEPLTDEQREALARSRCTHCGGVHTTACPRVKRMRFRPDGSTLVEVEFFDEWPKDRVIFLDDVALEVDH